MYRSVTASSTAPPLVGVYLGTRTMPLSEISNHIRIRKLVEANKEVGTTLAFFSYKEVDFSKEEFTGASFDAKKKSWTKRSFPFPDVVYVRGRGGKTKDLLEKFDYLGIKRINPIHAFNKGELFEQLIQDHNVRHHLPVTVSVEKTSEIKSAILKLGKVYVKARDGRRGLHVMRVETLSKNSGYLCTYSIVGKLVSKKADNMEHLLHTISSFFGDKKVVVQKAIDLVTISNNRLVDFRAEVQRNKKREIDIVGVCARAGQPHSPITTHSSAYRYDTYLPKLFPRYTTKQLNILKQNIKDFLRNIYVAVEKVYGKFGEMGIDFAVDKEGKLWLIECNAQSAKVSILKAYGSKARRVFVNPLEYALTIADSNKRQLYNQSSGGYHSSRSRNRSSYSNRSSYRRNFAKQ